MNVILDIHYLILLLRMDEYEVDKVEWSSEKYSHQN